MGLKERLLEKPIYTITPERATAIKDNIWRRFNGGLSGVPVPKDIITQEENEEILRYWKTLPGWTCYYDAVAKMARGEHLEGTNA